MRLSDKCTAGPGQARAAAAGSSRRRSWRAAMLAAVAAVGMLATSAADAAPAQTSTTTTTSSARECHTANRGRVLSTSVQQRLSRTQVADQLKQGGLPSRTRYGTDAYRLVYCTISPSGQPTVASGLLVLPQGERSTVSLVSYDHSTVAKKDNAPSFLDTDESQLISSFFAAAGFAFAAPDYLGLGMSPGLHPYMQATTEASATVDMLTAADRVSAQLHVRLSRKVFLTGFSQGGQAAMATGQELQRKPAGWTVRALAPISGPYDFNAEFPVIFDASRVDPHRASGYISYILTAWNRLYHLYASPRAVFTARVAGQIDSLFDGSHEIDAIAAALPPATELLRPAWRSMVQHPAGRLAAAIRANEVCLWAPHEPVRLYASHGDHDVVYANAETCLRQIADAGGHAQIEDMGEVDHVGTAIASVPLVRAWFSQLTP